MNRPTVVIVSDMPEFAATATRRWLAERNVPSFVLAESSATNEFSSGDFDLAIIGGVSQEALGLVLQTLKPAGKPIVHISRTTGNPLHNVISLPDVPEWPDLLITISKQIFECSWLSTELEKLQETNSQLERQASLGRYMLEVRHNLNNALTSILGNSDLILLDAASLTPSHRSQLETIRNMGMRLNEIMQRFSSLQKEMQLVEQSRNKSKTAVAGI